MKRLMVTVVVLMGAWSSTALADPWTNWAFDRGRHSLRFGRGSIIIAPTDPWTNWAFGRGYGYYDGYRGGFVHPNENVDVKYRERWDVQGGERSYEQSPSLPGKLIDLAAHLGGLAIIFH